MKSTKYSVFSLKVFGRFFSKYMEDQLEEKNIPLVRANIQMSYEEYYSLTIMNTFLSYIISFIFLLVFYMLIPTKITLLLLVFIPVLVTLTVGFAYLKYPDHLAKQRGKNIDLFLPYAINFISSMAVAGISPAEIFQTLSGVSVYGEVQNEAKKITKEITIMGMDNIRALKHSTEITPSKKLKTFLQGIIGTIQSGSDLHMYLHNIAERFMREDISDRKKDLDLLEVIAEVLVLSVIAFPIFLVIIVTVMGFFSGGGSSASSIGLLLLFSMFIIPIIYAMFYLLIKSTSLEKITRVELKNKSAKQYIENNKKSLLILIVSAIMVVVLFGLINLFVYLEYIALDPYYGMTYIYWDFAFFSFLIMLGPIGVYKYLLLRTKKEMQQKLPEFLNEVGDSLATGMNIFDAIRKAEKGHFGKLNPDIKKMKSQLSWQVSIKNVLFDFADRMQSAIVQRVVIVVDKGIMMGGNTPKIFKAAAQEVEQVNQVEYQRRSTMSIYALVILVCFFVFLGIIIILNITIFSTFFEIQTKQAAASQTIQALKVSTLDPTLLKYTLYSFVFVQSIGAGLLAGFMMDGRLASGVRYSLALAIVTIIIFKLFF